MAELTLEPAAPAKSRKAAKTAKPKPAKRGGILLFEWLTDNFVFKNFILVCIILNSIALGYDAHYGPNNPYHAFIDELDNIFLYIFTAELLLEFLAAGPSRYVKDGWNLFDCFIVGVSYMSAIPGITALRTFRVLRVLRLVSNVPQMRRVVEALIHALPGIFATVMVLVVVFYIGAVMATTMFRAEDGFHNLGDSALTLFQLSQFDGWGDTVVRLDAKYPYAWAFLMGFTVIAAFAVLNLFIGVIVDAVAATPREAMKKEVAEIKEDVEEIQKDIHEDVGEIAEAQEDAATMQKEMLAELRALRAELAAVKSAPSAT
ncbi:MAG TPA: ion transporter [Caulobacterales bacterium]|nr:ion transporter [Caulobacterales bacterium]